MRTKVIFFIGLLALFSLSIVIVGTRNIYIMYIKLAKKTTILTTLNEMGLPNGETIEFVDGNLLSKQNYNNGSLDGESVRYFANGRIKTRAIFKDNKPEGMQYMYYENGKLKYRLNYKGGKQFGSCYSYFLNGKLETYSVFDITGERFFLIQYNSSGEIVTAEGPVVSYNLYSTQSQSGSPIVLNNDLYRNNRYRHIKDLFITVVFPPDFTTTVDVKINGTIYKNLKIDSNTAKVSNAFPSTGPYDIFIESHLTDKHNREVNGINVKTKIIKF